MTSSHTHHFTQKLGSLFLSLPKNYQRTRRSYLSFFPLWVLTFLKMRRFDDDAALLRCARFEKSLSLAFLWRVEELRLEEQGVVHSFHGTLHVLHLRVGVPFEKV